MLTDRSEYRFFIVVKYVGPGAGNMRHNICFRNCFSLFLQQLVRLHDNLWYVRLPYPDVPAPSRALDFVLVRAFLFSPFQDAAQRPTRIGPHARLWFPRVLFGAARPPSHSFYMQPRNARVVFRTHDVTDIGQSFLHAEWAEPWLPQVSSLRERASFIVYQHPDTFLKLRQVNSSVVCALLRPCSRAFLSNSA
jgi:hypothetical protein